MFNQLDVPYHRDAKGHNKAAGRGTVAAAIGGPAVFISLDAMVPGQMRAGHGYCRSRLTAVNLNS